MLGIRQFICLWFVLASAYSFAISPQSRIPYIHTTDYGIREFLDLKERMESETDLQSMVDHLKELKILCETKNLQIPNLTVFLSAIRNKLAEGSLEIDDATFDWLYEEFWAFEDFAYADWDPIRSKRHHNNKKHKSKELRISTKTALGFLKFMGGALMCIIPVPLVQGAGATLAAVGISDMVDGCHGDKSSNTAEEKMRSLQQSPASG